MSVSQKQIDDFEENGPTWVAFPSEQGVTRYKCRLHPETGWFTAISTCIGCVFGLDNPPCPPDVERPHYWEESTMPVIVWRNREIESGYWYVDCARKGEPCLRCTFHDRRFAFDQACKDCLDEDAACQSGDE